MPTPTVLLMDIEGTTTSIAFVHDALFPFAREALPGFLGARWQEPEVAAAVTLMAPAATTPEAAAQVALALMDADVKDTGLKALQGRIWAEGYASGALRGHVFPDVAPALRQLAAAGVRLAIYSSGSVEAQRLLFGHSEAGDLTPLLCAHFDTTTGPKREAASYAAIAASLRCAPEVLLFVSDHPAELSAAAEAGLQVAALVRPGNAPLPEGHPFEILTDFSPLAARFGV
jgi:enolase-phosphatase E1